MGRSGLFKTVNPPRVFPNTIKGIQNRCRGNNHKDYAVHYEVVTDYEVRYDVLTTMKYTMTY